MCGFDMKKLIFNLIIISLLFLSINKSYSDIYDNLLDMYNNCQIDENNEIILPSRYDVEETINCNIYFYKKNNYVKSDGKISIRRNARQYTPSFETFDVKFRKFDDKHQIFFDSIEKDLDNSFGYKNRKVRNIPLEIATVSNSDTNKIELLMFFFDPFNVSFHKTKEILKVRDVSSDVCFDVISNYADLLSDKHNLSNKWKESSAKKISRANYPNGNPVFNYIRKYTYSLPDNKKIILRCNYIPYIKDKSFYWTVTIYYTDQYFFELTQKKNI